MSIPLKSIQPFLFNRENVNYHNILLYDGVLLMGEVLKQKFLPSWGIWTFVFDVGVSGYGLAFSNREIEPQTSYPFILQMLLARRLFILSGEGMSLFGQEGVKVLDKIVWATLCAEVMVSMYFSCHMPSNDSSDQRTFGITPRG